MRRLRWGVLSIGLLSMACGSDGAGSSDGGGGGPDGGGPGPGPDASVGETAEVHLVGRFDRSVASEPRFAWPGSAMWTRFDGTTISVTLDDGGGGNWFEVIVDAYDAFVQDLRAEYQDAWIFVALSPMLTDSFPGGAMHRTLARQHLEDVVAAAAARGDDRVSLLELAEQDPADGYGCDYHPNVVTNEKMAGVLLDAVRQVTGW